MIGTFAWLSTNGDPTAIKAAIVHRTPIVAQTMESVSVERVGEVPIVPRNASLR